MLHTLWSIDVSKVNGPVEKFGPQTGNFLGWRPRAQQKGYSKFSMDLGNSGPDGLSPLLFLYGLLPPNSAISKLFLFFPKLRKYARHKFCLSDNDHLRFKLALSQILL